MQICTLPQTDNHASTPPLSFYRPDDLHATQPTNLVKISPVDPDVTGLEVRPVTLRWLQCMVLGTCWNIDSHHLKLCHFSCTLITSTPPKLPIFSCFGGLENSLCRNLEIFHWYMHLNTDSHLLFQNWSKSVQDKWPKGCTALVTKRNKTYLAPWGVWIEQGLTSHQTHYRSYRGRVFMGQMTQPTVSKHWRKIGPKD